MPSLRHILLFIHVLAAIFWVGEILFVGLVVGPYARTLDLEARKKLFQAVGRRSLPFAWGAMVTLLITGLGNVALMGFPLSALFTASFYRTIFGETLRMKLIFVIMMFVTSGVHDLVLNRKSRALGQALKEAPPHEAAALSSQYASYRKNASLLGRLNFVLALVVIYFATQLVTGP